MTWKTRHEFGSLFHKKTADKTQVLCSTQRFPTPSGRQDENLLDEETRSLASTLDDCRTLIRASHVLTKESKLLTLRSDLGRKGEELAAAYLDHRAFKSSRHFTFRSAGIVTTRYQCRIDLVLTKGPSSFCRRKRARRIGLRHRRRMSICAAATGTRAARVYRRMFGLEAEPYRFDVVSIVLPSQEDSKSE